MRLLSSRRMREIDAASSALGVTTLTLMRNAGARVAARAAVEFGDPLLIVCGKGNNGGDGLAAALVLAGMGRRCRVLLCADPAGLTGDALAMYREVQEHRLPVEVVTDDLHLVEKRLGEARSIIDALFGTGLAPPARPPWGPIIEAISSSGKPVLSVDLPSGLDADSGVVSGPVVGAAVTVTLGFPKPALFVHPAAARAGRIVVADIGHPASVLAELSDGDPLLLESTWCRQTLPARLAGAHKGDFGHLLVVAGSRRYPGAALLAALGGLRSGAGLVSLATPGRLAHAAVPSFPELMPLSMDESPDGGFAASAVEALAEACAGKGALVLGPGLSVTPDTALLVGQLLSRTNLPVVIDADALNVLAGDQSPLASRLAPTIISPHPGELARLLCCSTADVQDDRLGFARKAADLLGTVVVLKGAGTLVTGPGIPSAVSASGNPGMASGGMGDVLAGVLGGFLAQGMPPMTAACLGVYLHGLAGDMLAGNRPWGFRASEVADGVPMAAARVLGGYDDIAVA